MAEAGMDLVREISRVAKTGPESACAAAEAFAKITRAVRLTFALETKTHETLRLLRAGETFARETRRKVAAEKASDAEYKRWKDAEDKIEDLVGDVAAAEIEDDDDYEACHLALRERLTEDEAYADRLDRPLREVVEQLCKDLCLNPDWSRWTGEGWAPDANGRPAHSRFKHPRRTPTDWDDLSPEQKRSRIAGEPIVIGGLPAG